MKRHTLRYLALLTTSLLSACTAPQLSAPQLDMPAAFKEAATPLRSADGGSWKLAQAAEVQARGQWWLVFNDTALTVLIDTASAANANLSVAAARVRQARALAGFAEADRGVQLNAQLGVSRARAANPAPGAQLSTSWHSALSASYELDLFGRIGANVSAAQADAAASEASYRSVLLALQADVAQTYFRLRATDAELVTLTQTVQLREQSVQVNQRRFDLGDLGEFDLARAKTELATSRAEAIGLQRQRVNLEHALALLLGKSAASFAFEVQPLVEDATVPVIPAGLPSALLERRPDISAAQRAMVAANARIGVARAARFPALALTAAGGGESDLLSQVFKWDARSWVVGALLSMPLIDGGRRQADIARSEAVLDESLASYRQSVLIALAEVEDNLAGLRILAGQGEQLDLAVLSARRSAHLAQRLYLAGRSSYLDLLDAQRNLASIERNAVQLRGNRYVSSVALIRALGGGWSPQ